MVLVSYSSGSYMFFLLSRRIMAIDFIITNNYTLEEGILIGIITIIYSLSSIPSVWIGRWDLNNIKFQITGIIIMSLFITNQYFIDFSKGFLIYAIFTLFLQFIICILLFFKK